MSNQIIELTEEGLGLDFGRTNI